MLDTAQNQYSIGLRLLESGDLPAAQRAFDRAGALDPRHPGADIGTGLVALETGDLERAAQSIARGVQRSPDSADAHLAQARLLASRGQRSADAPGAWLAEAHRSLRRAAQLAPRDPRIPYYQGQTYLQAHQLDAARQAFTRVLELDQAPWAARGAAALTLVHQVELAAPGSQGGRRVVLSPQLTRAELAVLLIEELHLPDLLPRRASAAQTGPAWTVAAAPASPVPPPADVAQSWARPWIRQCLALGVRALQAFPDGTFQPDLPVSRAELALVAEDLLVVLSGDGSLRTRYVGERARFPDVPPDHYAYNAMALASERGLLQVDVATGAFDPGGAVPGVEALLLIRELQRRLPVAP